MAVVTTEPLEDDEDGEDERLEEVVRAGVEEALDEGVGGPCASRRPSSRLML